jgi:hypothetical protein
LKTIASVQTLSPMSDVTMTTTLQGDGGAVRIGIPTTPDWWTLAACRADGADRWVVERGRQGHLAELKAICAACPAAGDCLRDAFTLDPNVRRVGLVRCGTTGRSWIAVEALVAELQPSSDAEWSTVAAHVVDGDVRSVRRKHATTAA